MTEDQKRAELVARYVGAVFATAVTDAAGIVGLPVEVETLRRMNAEVSKLEADSRDERLLIDFARTTACVIWGTQHDYRAVDEWFSLVELWHFQRAGLLAVPAVSAMIPAPRDPFSDGPRFVEVPCEVDPIDAYTMSAAEEVRRAYEAGRLPGAA